jgi:hypothetical protein
MKETFDGTTLLEDSFTIKDSVVDNTHINRSRSQYSGGLKGALYSVNDDGYGNQILTKIDNNQVVFGGAVSALERIFNVTANAKPLTVNDSLDINKGISGVDAQSFIALFGVGSGGSTMDFVGVEATSAKRNNVPTPIPLRVGAAVTGPDADKYFMKLDKNDGTYWWYLKEFNSVPIIKTLWKDASEEYEDGTEVMADIQDSIKTEGIECFAECTLFMNTNDAREYWDAVGELDVARYNTMGLYSGQKVEVPTAGSGEWDYVNVRLMCYLNFNNRAVTTRTESTFIYRLYSLV